MNNVEKIMGPHEKSDIQLRNGVILEYLIIFLKIKIKQKIPKGTSPSITRREWQKRVGLSVLQEITQIAIKWAEELACLVQTE